MSRLLLLSIILFAIAGVAFLLALSVGVVADVSAAKYHGLCNGDSTLSPGPGVCTRSDVLWERWGVRVVFSCSLAVFTVAGIAGCACLADYMDTRGCF